MRPARFIWSRCWSSTKWSWLRLARQVLCGIFAVSVGVFAAHAYWDKNEALRQTFELVKIGALPLVTLVVSFYFPTSAAR